MFTPLTCSVKSSAFRNTETGTRTETETETETGDMDSRNVPPRSLTPGRTLPHPRTETGTRTIGTRIRTMGTGPTRTGTTSPTLTHALGFKI
jgi:hypothetical protein